MNDRLQYILQYQKNKFLGKNISFRDKLIVLARTNRFQSIEQELVSEQEKKK